MAMRRLPFKEIDCILIEVRTVIVSSDGADQLVRTWIMKWHYLNSARSANWRGYLSSRSFAPCPARIPRERRFCVFTGFESQVYRYKLQWLYSYTINFERMSHHYIFFVYIFSETSLLAVNYIGSLTARKFALPNRDVSQRMCHDHFHQMVLRLHIRVKIEDIDRHIWNLIYMHYNYLRNTFSLSLLFVYFNGLFF